MNKPKHTRSAGGVVVNAAGRVVVVNQRGNCWSLPKGHIEPGETPLAAARREIYEECGIADLEYVKYLGEYRRYRIGQNGGEDRSERKTIRMYLFRACQRQLRPMDPKHPEARWIAPDKVADLLTHPADRRFFKKIKPVLPINVGDRAHKHQLPTVR